ncbi:MAG: nuclear transport factor 2 family protein [Propionibacteriales bacterium]|nr:nuclear transport factor 2 family protein [Propionibacteriales bacterium]
MTEDRLAALEIRLARIEDELAITRLMASYGPLVDAGDASAVAALWAVDGQYDVEGWQMRSRADVDAMVRSEAHQHLINGGCSHFLGPAHIRIDGDEAIAVCESLLVRHRDGAFSVRRAGANQVRLRRSVADRTRWEIVHRTTRALTGSTEARDLLVGASEAARP